jgi:hypothetical protein
MYTPDAPKRSVFAPCDLHGANTVQMRHARPGILGGMNANDQKSGARGGLGALPNLDKTLRRSVELDEAAWAILSPEAYELYDDSEKIAAACSACEVSVEHGRALRLLISGGFGATAASVMRMQFEALVRAMWLFYAASDAAVAKVQAPLGLESEKAAGSLPMLAAMIKELDGKAPQPAVEMVNQFKTTMMGALNSFVHGGIHPLQRHRNGFPEVLAEQVLRNSNGLFTMAAMMLAIFTGDERVIAPMRTIQRDFAECLPELLAR